MLHDGRQIDLVPPMKITGVADDDERANASAQIYMNVKVVLTVETSLL